MADSEPSPLRPAGVFARFEREVIEQSIAARFERQAELHAGRLALRFGDLALTYSELDRAANRLAGAILASEGPGDQPVALLFGQQTGMIVALLAVLKAGRVAVPLDAASPPARNERILRDSGAALLVSDAQAAGIADAIGTGRRRLDPAKLGPEWSEARVGVRSSPESWACILYTSGSTGHPKGVVHDHRSLLHLVMRHTNLLHIGADDRCLHLASCSHIAGFFGVLRALLNGAAVLPYDIRARGLDPLAAWIRDEGITIYQSTPTVFRHFAGTLDGQFGMPGLRLVHLGGEPVTPREVELFRRQFPVGCVLLNSYGCTEIASFRQYFITHETPLPGDAVPVGYPAADIVVRLLDDANRESEAGAVGEIVVTSRYLARGYWQDGGLNQGAFPPGPKRDGERSFHTGDLGRFLPDGCLLYLGRKDLQVNVRGYRVEVKEIETALLDASPAVAEAAVVVGEDRRGAQRLVAYYVPATAGEVSPTELREALRTRLPEHMIPSGIVRLDALPLTAGGKVDRRALPAWSGLAPRETPLVPAGTPVERWLAGVWSEVLGVEEIGIRDDFQELGGDSVQAIRIVARLREQLGMDLPASLLSAPTIERAALALVVCLAERLGHAELTQLVPHVGSSWEDG